MARLKAWDAKATGKVKAVAKATVEATVDAVNAGIPDSARPSASLRAARGDGPGEPPHRAETSPACDRCF